MLHHAGLTRSLRRQLRELMDARQLKQGDLAAGLHCSAAKVSRILGGRQTLMPWTDLQMLMDILDADRATRDQLNGLWTQIKASRATFAQWSDILSPAEIEYHEALQCADVAELQAGFHFPIIVRAPQYQAALLEMTGHSPAQIARWQELLPAVKERVNPDRRLQIIIDEGALRGHGLQGFHEQLDELLIAYQGGAQIHILSRDRPLMRGILQQFTMMQWVGEPAASLVSVAWIHQAVDWIAEGERRQVLRSAWQELLPHLSKPSELPAIIERAHRQCESLMDPRSPG